MLLEKLSDVSVGEVGEFQVRETAVTIPLDGTDVGGLLRQPLGDDGAVARSDDLLGVLS